MERINLDLGVFDIRPRTGRNVAISIPYNARAGDVDSFRSLRRGDHVRVEGEFVNSESFQLLAFLSPRQDMAWRKSSTRPRVTITRRENYRRTVDGDSLLHSTQCNSVDPL